MRDRKFRGVVNVDIRDSVPDWSPFEAPKAQAEGVEGLGVGGEQESNVHGRCSVRSGDDFPVAPRRKAPGVEARAR